MTKGDRWGRRGYSIVKEQRGRLREEANTVGCPQQRPTGGIRRREGDFGREISDFRRLAEGVAGEGVVCIRYLGELLMDICYLEGVGVVLWEEGRTCGHAATRGVRRRGGDLAGEWGFCAATKGRRRRDWRWRGGRAGFWGRGWGVVGGRHGCGGVGEAGEEGMRDGGALRGRGASARQSRAPECAVSPNATGLRRIRHNSGPIHLLRA